MSQRDLHRHHTLRLVLEHRLTGAHAATALGLTERHVWWLVTRLRQDGRRALVQGNRGRPSGRRLPGATPQQILALARGTYAGLNTTRLTEKLPADHGLAVSRAAVHRRRPAGVVSPRRAQAGRPCQLDGSPGTWCGPTQPARRLLAAMDAATGRGTPGPAGPRRMPPGISACGTPWAGPSGCRRPSTRRAPGSACGTTPTGHWRRSSGGPRTPAGRAGSAGPGHAPSRRRQLH